MSFTLETLSQGLSQQFQGILETAYNHLKQNTTAPYIHCSQVFKIDGFAGSVFVDMQRVTQEIPQGVAVCGGSFCQHSAEVFINPENEQLAQVVEAHFKAQIKPAMAMMPSRPIFNSVIINGKQIKL